MYDRAVLLDRMEDVLELLETVPKRFETISRPEDFRGSEDGRLHMDAICMVLIAAGEEFKSMDRKTQGGLFSRYPDADWRGAMRLRDVMAHGYLDIDERVLFAICRDNIPPLIAALRKLVEDLRHGVA